jgi:hypothetical protein
MSKSKIVTVILFGIFMLIGSQCRKNNADPTLPPETTNGAGTFGCKINGRNFVPRSGRGQPGLYVRYYREFSGLNEYWSLAITAGQYKDRPTETIQIGTDTLLVESGETYQFDRGQGKPFVIYTYGYDNFQYKPAKAGDLFITKHDRDARILSGRFWFNIYSLADSSIVRVTEGRFDVRY